jgi:hypothetical protein
VEVFAHDERERRFIPLEMEHVHFRLSSAFALWRIMLCGTEVMVIGQVLASLTTTAGLAGAAPTPLKEPDGGRAPPRLFGADFHTRSRTFAPLDLAFSRLTASTSPLVPGTGRSSTYLY